MILSLWNAIETSLLVEGKMIGSIEWAANGVSIDSRTIKKKDLFIALKGDKFNGHDYIKSAFTKGAVAAIVNNIPEEFIPNANYILVQDTHKALDYLGIAGRERGEIKVIGITGSVGKTTTKDFLNTIINDTLICHANKGNFNNRIGVPLTLSQIPRNANITIQEMGMSNSGDIRTLSKLTRPDIAIITAIGGSHLGNFSNIDEIANTKAEIFEGMTKDGIIVLPSDCKYLKLLIQRADKAGINKIFYFGTKKFSHARLLSLKNKYNYLEANINLMGSVFKIKVPGHLPHNVFNSLSAILVFKILGLNLKNENMNLTDFKVRNGRGNIYNLTFPSGSRVIMVDDSYNASFESISASISALRNLSLSSPFLILGDILDLGNSSISEHNKLIPIIEKCKPKTLLTIGPQMGRISKKINSKCNKLEFSNAESAAKNISKFIEPNDVILVKGSNGMNLKKVVNIINKTFKISNKVKSNVA